MSVAAEPLIPVPAVPRGHAYRHVTVAPVAGACGAVLGGVDLATDLDDAVIAEIRRAVLDHHVVFFRKQLLAFRALSPGMQTMLERLTGIHSAVNAYSPKMQRIHDIFSGMTVRTSERANDVQRHPVVRVHSETGQKALFVNAQYTIGLDGFAPHESKPILDLLFAHSVRPEMSCRWRWEVGDVAFWDNRCFQHMAMADFTGHRRALHRTTIAGEAPVGVSG